MTGAAAMAAADGDVFDQVARLVRDNRLIEKLPRPKDMTPNEWHLSVETARKAHLETLARFMRVGGMWSEFDRETLHLHGGSSHGLPYELAILFRNCPTPTAEQCWDFICWWRWREKRPWPGRTSQLPAPLPPDDKILAKMLAMMDEGLGRDKAAKLIRSKPGFEGVGNEHARRVIAGARRRGRPSKKPAG